MYLPIRIVIADDHEIFRNGFKLLLQDQHEVELVGEADNGNQLIDAVNTLQPSVVITDIKMPGMDGIEASRILKEQNPSLGIIALSNYNEDSLIVDILEAGARGYLLKNTNREELITAVKAVHGGESYYCTATSSKLTKMIAESRFNPYRSMPRIRFTDRELDVIRLICEQKTNKEIASTLKLSVRTVESYRENIQEKISARNSVGIVIYAIKNKIFDP
jgi:DNA-binding NarL/FixJ family response regulator